uniref:Uncharacterized protein n=1 Tax=Avena sativa TaxID=4498 RepID=A0ACD5Z6B9_AVESA
MPLQVSRKLLPSRFFPNLSPISNDSFFSSKSEPNLRSCFLLGFQSVLTTSTNPPPPSPLLHQIFISHRHPHRISFFRNTLKNQIIKVSPGPFLRAAGDLLDESLMEEQALSPIREEGSPMAPHNPPSIEAPEIPQLRMGIQAMNLQEQSQQSAGKEEEDKYTLLVKVACSGGTPKNLSLSIVQQAMARAWRSSYHKITQVHQHIFKAHFLSFQAMMSVFTRQPWSVSSDTLLFELDNSKNKAVKKECYKFEFIYVTVRDYGIPASNRSLKVLKNILELVGTQSEFHELRQVMLTSRQDYIWGIARMRVCTPVLDRIKLKFSETESGMTYLHYEKIGRICLFCGVMFHTSQNCHLRQQIVTEKLELGQSAHDVPYQRYGPWIINPDLIPNNFAVHGPESNPVFSTFQNPHLSRFQRLFESPQTRKGSLERTSTTSQLIQLQSSHGKKCNEVGEGSSAMEENLQGKRRHCSHNYLYYSRKETNGKW